MERSGSVSSGCLAAVLSCATIAALVPADANANARQKHLEKIGVIVADGRGSGGGSGSDRGGGGDATDFPRMEVRGIRQNLPSVPTDLTGLMLSTSPTTSSTGRVSENGGAREQETDAKDDCAGNPVILATGNKIEPELDFDSAGEMGLYLSRVYNKQWSGRGIFGRNWLSNFDYSLASQSVGTRASCGCRLPTAGA